MRFLLDEDVDVAVCKVIARAGHECFTVRDLGLLGAGDDDVSVAGDDRDAVFVTHDRKLITKRRRNSFGRHVRLDCKKHHAVEFVADRIDEIARILMAFDIVTLEVHRNRIQVHPPRWD